MLTERESSFHKLPRRPRDGYRVHPQNPHSALDKLIAVEKVEQESVLPVADHLLHGGRRGAQHGRAAGHGLQHRPRQHERVAEVDVQAADLQELQIVCVGNSPHEMGAGHVEIRAHLREQHLPVTAVRLRRRGAITHSIGTDDHEVRLGQTPLQFGQRTHIGMEATVGFELTADETHHLGFTPEFAPVGEPVACARIRTHRLQIDSLVNHTDPRLLALRIGGALPRGRADAGIGFAQGVELSAVADA